MSSWDQSQVNAYYARQNAAKAQGGGSQAPAVTDETELHNDILEECARRGWLALHGSMAHRTFRTAGEFDFIVLCDEGRVLLIEAKSKTGKLSTEQAALHAWARKLGHAVWVVRNMEDFNSAARDRQ